MTLGRHSGFRHVPGETGTTCKKAVFILLFPREIQEIKWKKGILDLKSNNCVEFSVFNVFS